MLIYPKTKKGVQKDSPVWKEDNFLRLRGLADALVHKTDFKTEDGKNVLAGAYYEHIRRELETLEAAKLAQLSKSLGPKAAALKAMPQPTGGSSNSSSPRSTGARRAAREAGERRARAASERKELAASIRAELLDAEAEINEVYCPQYFLGKCRIRYLRKSNCLPLTGRSDTIPFSSTFQKI